MLRFVFYDLVAKSQNCMLPVFSCHNYGQLIHKYETYTNVMFEEKNKIVIAAPNSNEDLTDSPRIRNAVPLTRFETASRRIHQRSRLRPFCPATASGALRAAAREISTVGPEPDTGPR